MVALNMRRLGHLRDRHGRMILEQPGQVAFVLGREVQNDHKRQIAIVARVLEELLQRLQPARRRANADDPRPTERLIIGRTAGSAFPAHADRIRSRVPQSAATTQRLLTLIPAPAMFVPSNDHLLVISITFGRFAQGSLACGSMVLSFFVVGCRPAGRETTHQENV